MHCKNKKIFLGIIFLLFSVLSSFFLTACGESDPPPSHTPTTEVRVTPNPDKHINVTVADEGTDIYIPTNVQPNSYRYGTCLIVNEDASIDAWYAAPGPAGQADWIVYNRSEDGGKTWSPEKVVLKPTGNSMDFFSVCDPGVIKIGEYYYLGYTSTIFSNAGGYGNNCFVARSKTPDGPYEKWNGEGWGGDPMPIIYFDENSTNWGAGEVSFVELDGTLYIYYTWISSNTSGKAVSETRVSVADATDKNWPATIEYKGVAIKRQNGNDSADIKYIDEYGKFIAMNVANRMTAGAYLEVYESDDGITFTSVDKINAGISRYTGNLGISGDQVGHIHSGMSNYVAYSYGITWPSWATRLHKIDIVLTDTENPEREADYLDIADFTPIPVEYPLNIIGFYSQPEQYNLMLGTGATEIGLYTVNYLHQWEKMSEEELEKVVFEGFDSSVISLSGNVITPLKTGKTVITASYNGSYTYIRVSVRPEGESVRKSVSGVDTIQDKYIISLQNCDFKQIRALVYFEDGSVTEKSGSAVKYTDYDKAIVTILEDGSISPQMEGKTSVTLTHRGFSKTVEIEVVA